MAKSTLQARAFQNIYYSRSLKTKEARLLVLLDHSISINTLFQLSQMNLHFFAAQAFKRSSDVCHRFFSFCGNLSHPCFNKQLTYAPNYRLQRHKIPQIRQEIQSTFPLPLKPVLYLTQNEETL